jgi:6-bladed beta-propeller
MERLIRNGSVLVAAGAALGVGACSPGPSGGAFAVRDSAGIRVAESTAPAWKQGEGWRISAKPLAEVGTTEGDPHYQFTVMVGGVMLPDETVIADAGSSSLRAFSNTGEFLWEAGRKGEGPGEFQYVTSLALLPPDSLLVYDRRLLRVSVFTARGTFTRSFKLDVDDVSGVFPVPDGSLVLATGGSSGLLPSPPKENVPERERDPVYRVDREGGHLDTLGVFPGMEWVMVARGIGPPPFAHHTSLTIRDTTVVIGTSDDMSVQIRSLDGALEGLVRLRGVDLSVTDADMAAYRTMMLGLVRNEEQRTMIQERLDAMRVPARKAAYGRVEVDGEGDVWLEDVAVGSPFPPGWSVFSPDGRYLGRVGAPERFRVLELGASRVLGYWTDPMDVPHVRIYAIDK